ncbi:hypothetical protein BG005_002757 [Podila minutissima]|nr:hypothetical protein BG005_002757 [Podila minutissima]
MGHKLKLVNAVQLQTMHPLGDTLVESPATAPDNIFGSQNPEPRLEPFCTLIQYLYTGKVALEIDLSDFSLYHWPISTRMHIPDRRTVTQEILAAPLRKVTWLELHELAVRYGLNILRELCAKHLEVPQTVCSY